MTSRELVTAALTFKEYDVVPIETRDCAAAPCRYPQWYSGTPVNQIGRRTDPWECTWESLEEGVCGEVKGHPLADWSGLDDFSPPWHILDMDIEELANRYHHKVAFWGEIDRQYTQAFGTEEDMRKAVRRLADAFFRHGHTGLVAQCLYTMNVPEPNKRAEREEWLKVI